MKYIRRVFCPFIIFITANIPFMYATYRNIWFSIAAAIAFCIINILPTLSNRKLKRRKYRICADGCELLIYFLISVTASVLHLACKLPLTFQGQAKVWMFDFLCVLALEALVFWNGITRVYCFSSQIGLKWRIIGVVCAWIPGVNIFVLYKIIRISYDECRFESDRIKLNEERKDQRLCETKYPLLMVHGVFFRDFKYFNYWGRVPEDLEANGATIFYGNHQSAASVEAGSKELAKRILELVSQQACEKVNIIAHSKGGLDCRYALSELAVSPYVASLTTINTPHRGCIFADHLLHKIKDDLKQKIAGSYNAALKKLGDENPDFIAAVTDLTAGFCKEFNGKIKDVPGVYYQSYGSKLHVASGGRFPLNFSHTLVTYFDGPNDGLVAEASFPWGESYTFLTSKGKRGISHGDMIDLNRENFKGFDVREFYVSLVNDLKKKGY